MLGNLTGWHMIIILAIILLLFGAPKLPALAKSIAQSMRIFKNEIGDDKKRDGADGTTTSSTGSTAPTSSTTASSTDGDLHHKP